MNRIADNQSGAFWDERRRESTRRLLAAGVTRQAIAQRYGISVPTLRTAINRYRLNKPAEATT
jgi:DNA invertase Pin-like site-specific DNA recombinase